MATTYSVRHAVLDEDAWLGPSGTWGEFAQRKRFRSQDEATAFVKGRFGEAFERFGVFPNSSYLRPTLHETVVAATRRSPT